MQKRFDLVILDLDGTMIDNRVAIRTNFNYTLGLHKYDPLPDKEIDSMIGTALVEMFERTLLESDRHLAPQMVDEYRERYSGTSHEGVVILDGVVPMLEYLRQNGFKSAVATTKADVEVHPLLQRIGLYGYFNLITGFREGIRTKPHPDMVQYIMRELDVRPERTALVGDTPTDIMTARNAGIYPIAVTTSVPLGMTTLDKIYAARPDVVIDSLRELPNHLYVE